MSINVVEKAFYEKHG